MYFVAVSGPNIFNLIIASGPNAMIQCRMIFSPSVQWKSHPAANSNG